MENRRFNQIKKFLWQITPKNKLRNLSEKKFLLLGALLLIKWHGLFQEIT